MCRWAMFPLNQEHKDLEVLVFKVENVDYDNVLFKQVFQCIQVIIIRRRNSTVFSLESLNLIGSSIVFYVTIRLRAQRLYWLIVHWGNYQKLKETESDWHWNHVFFLKKLSLVYRFQNDTVSLVISTVKNSETAWIWKQSRILTQNWVAWEE